MRYVAGVPWLWVGIAVTSVVLMVAMARFQALAPTFVQEQFGKGVGAYGLFAFEATGMTAGMVALGQIDHPHARDLAGLRLPGAQRRLRPWR